MRPHPVRITPIRERHLADIQRYAANEVVAATCNLPHPYPENGAAQFYKHVTSPQLKGRRYTFAIEQGGEFRGVCGIGRDLVTDPAAEVGYWIALPFWGQGVAKAATRLLVEFGFKKMRLQRQVARCLAENPASRKVLESNGFRYVRTAAEQYAKWPEPRETDYLELTRPDWDHWRKHGSKTP